jgi:hypothetical protein
MYWFKQSFTGLGKIKSSNDMYFVPCFKIKKKTMKMHDGILGINFFAKKSLRWKIHVIAGFNFTLAYLPDFKQTVKVVKTFIFDDKNILKQGDYLLKIYNPW